MDSESILKMAETNAAAQLATKRPRRSMTESKFLGCLLGGAVGDALGAPVEFMRREQILHRFGADGITGYAPVYGGPGKITDDTQMTLFTAEGLLRAEVRGHLKGIKTYSEMTAHAYLRWLQTQGEKPSCDMHQADEETGWLFKHKELHSRRAPGTTCLAALRAMQSFGEPAQNNSKGCGGVMRVAPVGLFTVQKKWSAEETFKLGAELAALTHGHPTGSLAAGALAVLVLRLAEGAALVDALALTRSSQSRLETMKH
jgi:ADP-ribosylglycohydrolase